MWAFTSQVFVCLCMHQHMWGDIHRGEEDVGCTILQHSTLFTWDTGSHWTWSLCLVWQQTLSLLTTMLRWEVHVCSCPLYTWVLRICTQVLMSMHSAILPNWAIYSALYLKAVCLSINSWPLYASFIVSACEMGNSIYSICSAYPQSSVGSNETCRKCFVYQALYKYKR